jgi:glutamate/tyrosine decarboxylase-like PLP-dependent enzyme
MPLEEDSVNKGEVVAPDKGHNLALLALSPAHPPPALPSDRLPYTLDYGPQNSRSFRALRVWLARQHVGRKGYEQMLGDDVQLAKRLYELVAAQPELEAFTNSLSITMFRYVPRDLSLGNDKTEEYLNQLNTELLTRLQNSGSDWW